MPEGFSVLGGERKRVAVRIPGKRESGICGQNACTCATFTQFMGPANLARLVVDGIENTLAPETVISACPKRASSSNGC